MGKKIKIIAPDSDIFSPEQLEIAEKQPKLLKPLLITMGVTKKSDQDHIIDEIKKMIVKHENPNDVWH